MKKVIHCIVGAVLTMSVAGAMAQQKPVVVDGNVWLNASAESRKAFLAGANSMIALEMAYARKKGTQPPAAGTAFHDATGEITLDDMSERITRWYQDHPERRQMPVLGAAWLDMVSPGAGKKAQ